LLHHIYMYMYRQSIISILSF